jgi:hypothetical protein
LSRDGPILVALQHRPANGTVGGHLTAIGQKSIDPDEMLNAEPALGASGRGGRASDDLPGELVCAGFSFGVLPRAQ